LVFSISRNSMNKGSRFISSREDVRFNKIDKYGYT
jgi:hypothetical protein